MMVLKAQRRASAVRRLNRLCTYVGWVVVRTLQVIEDRSLYSISNATYRSIVTICPYLLSFPFIVRQWSKMYKKFPVGLPNL